MLRDGALRAPRPLYQLGYICDQPYFLIVVWTQRHSPTHLQWMQLFARFSWRKLSSSFCSAGDRGNVWERGSSVPGVRSMAWSHAFCGGSSSKASLEKTSLKSWYWAGTMFLGGWLSSAFCASWASCCDGVSVAIM